MNLPLFTVAPRFPMPTCTYAHKNVNSFCIAKNQPECHFSVNLRTAPRAEGASKRNPKRSGPSGNGGGGGGGGGFVPVGDHYSAVVHLKR